MDGQRDTTVVQSVELSLKVSYFKLIFDQFTSHAFTYPIHGMEEVKLAVFYIALDYQIPYF